MPVFSYRVGREPLVDLAEQPGNVEFRPARSGHAGLGIHYYRAHIDGSVRHQRGKRENRSGRVAARIRDKPCPGNLSCAQLAYAVDRLVDQFGRGVVASVVMLVRGQVLEPEVRRHIDELLAVVHKPRRKLHAHTVALRLEIHVSGIGRVFDVILLANRQVLTQETRIGV